jgi:hypothetical protein
MSASHPIEEVKDAPIKAPAVNRTLKAVTFPGPKRPTTHPLLRLLIMVPPDRMKNTTPAVSKDAPSSKRITGQTLPSRESGNPRLIKVR